LLTFASKEVATQTDKNHPLDRPDMCADPSFPDPMMLFARLHRRKIVPDVNDAVLRHGEVAATLT
jgi:hypothetical protein